MFIIWRGYGFLVPIITIVVGGLVSGVTSVIFNRVPLLGMCLGTLASAAVIWFVGNKLNNPAKARVMIDKQTGQEFLLKQNHSLFFIKMQYWAYPIALIGIILLVTMVISK